MKSEWRIVSNTFSISTIHINLDDQFQRCSIAEANLMEDGLWRISRVKVDDSVRRAGIGLGLVHRIQGELAKKEGFVAVRVQPGGYGSDPQDLQRFYEKCGFEVINPIPCLNMEWRPEAKPEESALTFGPGVHYFGWFRH